MMSFMWVQWLVLSSLLLSLPCSGGATDCQRIEIKHGAVHRKHKAGHILHLEFECDPGYRLAHGVARVPCTLDGVVKRGYKIPKCRKAAPHHGSGVRRKNSHKRRPKFNIHHHQRHKQKKQEWPKAGFIF